MRKARSSVEKVLFVAMMLTAAEYTFQTTLFAFVIEHASRKRVTIFEDLHQTGALMVLVSPMVYDELAVSDNVSPKLPKRFKPTHAFEDELTRVRSREASKGFFMS